MVNIFADICSQEFQENWKHKTLKLTIAICVSFALQLIYWMLKVNTLIFNFML
jgi:hypothetical protein